MMKKRLLALLLAMAMIMALMAGCGSSTTSETNEASEAAASEAQEETQEEEETEESTDASQEEEEPVEEAGEVVETPISLPIGDGTQTYTVWMGISPSAMNYISSLAENQTYIEWMERTGINLEFEHFHPDNQETNFTLIVASGDYPDVMSGVGNSYSSGADAAIADGVFLDHTDLIEEYAPNYWSIITSDQSVWDAVTTSGNQIVGFYSLYSSAMMNDSGTLIRQDFLDAVGMDMPTTTSELYDVLVAFRDQLGVTDGLFIQADGTSEFIMSAFGIGVGYYLDGDTVKYGPIQDEYKEYLTYLNQLYTEGLLYADFPFYGEQRMFTDRGMIGEGSVAIFASETAEMVSLADFSDDENFLLVAISSLVNEETGIATITEGAPSRADDIRWSITTGCEDPELLVQMIDYLYTEEGALLANYGIEGETFYYDDNGDPLLTDLVVNNPDGLDYRTAMFLNLMDTGPFMINENRGTQDYTEAQLVSRSVWNADTNDYSGVIPDKAALSQEENEELANYSADMETYMDEWVVKFITGDTSLDEFDTYIEGMLSLGAETCVALYQQAYDRYLES